jgi:phage gp29-like protein
LIFHRGAARSGHDTRNGILRVTAWMYLFKNYAWKDWVVFNEKFGMPLILGKYEPSASPADREALVSAIRNLGTDAAGVISKSTEVEFVEAVSRLSGTTNPYQAMIEMCNREMSKAVLGQTLTTDSAPGSGTLAGNAHENVRQDLLEADAEMLAETIREQIIRPLVGFNFGWDKAIPGFSLPIQDSPDLKADSERDKNLEAIGVPMPLSYFYEHYGIPEPKADEPTTASIKTPANPQPPAGSGPDPGGRPALEPPAAAGKKGKRGKGEKDGPAAMKAELPGRDETISFADNGLGELGSLPQDRQMIDVLKELETLTQASLAGISPELNERFHAPVLELLRRAGSLEEFRDGLLAIFKDMEVSGFVDHLHQSMVLANLRGRLNV